MDKLRIYIKTSIRQILKAKYIFAIIVFAFSLSIFTYFLNQRFNDDLHEKLKNSGSFENFRIFDHIPRGDFYWDEFHEFLGINFEEPTIKKDDYPILGYTNVIPANFIDKNTSKKIVFADENVFKLLGIEKPKGELRKGEYWAKESFRNDLKINGKIFRKALRYREINKTNAYDFDAIIPIENLNKEIINRKLNNIFLFVAPGFNAPDITKKATKIFNNKYNAVRVWTENGIASDTYNASEYQFSEVLDLYAISLFALSFFLYF